MFLVVSNTGNWDHDMWGVVGVVDSLAHVPAFIAGYDPENDMNEVEYVFGNDECNQSFEANEVNFLCEGTPIAYAIYEPDGCFPSIYYLVELKT